MDITDRYCMAQNSPSVCFLFIAGLTELSLILGRLVALAMGGFARMFFLFIARRFPVMEMFLSLWCLSGL